MYYVECLKDDSISLTAFKAMTKHSAYIEDMSMIFMDVGRSSPRYQELALLYSRSHSLQAKIHEYFIIVVRFCGEMMRFMRKSAFAQFTSSLNSEATKKTRSDLLLWASEIESEASILLARRIEDEASENSRFRLMSNKFSKSTSEQQRLARKLRILDKCSKYDHETTWKQIRKLGNTSLFTKDATYQDWKTAPESCTLLLFGKLGSGKSVTLANIVDDLMVSVGQHRDPVVFFFVRQDLPESMKSRTVIGSLARQLLRSKEDFTNAVRIDRQDTDTCLSVQDLIALLRQNHARKNKVYLLLDGLDLCDDSDKVEIIDFVRQLQLHGWILVCASLRQESAHSVEEVYHNFVKYTRTSLPDNKPDIEDFVEAELSRCLRTNTLILGDARLVLRIHDALLSGSRGMFLWVVLQIRTLCTMATDDDIIAALEELPEDLEETYGRILDKLQRRQKKYQTQILRFILTAQQPLDMDEMREVLSVTVGDTNWTTARIINDIETTLKSCGCLIYVDEEERTVRFVHPSVRAYLLRNPDSLGLGIRISVWLGAEAKSVEPAIEMLMQLCHSTMAEVIVTYLSYGVLETQVLKAGRQQIYSAAAPSKIVESVTTQSRSVQRIALGFLAQRKSPDFDLGKVLAQEARFYGPRKREDFVFQVYARRWCLYHVSACDGKTLGGHVARLLPDLLSRHGNAPELAHSEIAFRMAIDHDNERLLALLLASPLQAAVNFRFEIRHQDRTISYSLMDFAVCKGNQRIVEMLLPHADQPVLSDPYPPTFAICDLLYRGDLARTSRLTSSVPFVERIGSLSSQHYAHICQSGRNILACAIWAGNMSAVKAVLADERSTVMRNDYFTITEALRAPDETALKLLLDPGQFAWTLAKKTRLEKFAAERGLIDIVPLLSQILDLQ